MDLSIKPGPRRPFGGVSYEVALRAIGQDLTPLVLESLLITAEGPTLVAQVWVVGRAPETVEKKKKGLLRRFLGNRREKAAAKKNSARSLIVRKYAPEDVKRLDTLGATRQTGAQAIPDASSLAEALRNIGRVVDSSGGRLVSLSRDRQKVAFSYTDQNDKAHHEERYSLSHHRSQQEAVSLRRKGDRWEDSK